MDKETLKDNIELVQEQVMKDILSNRLKEVNEELIRAKEEITRLKK